MNPSQLPGSTDRELQLELVRVRAEAAAARLEARAAEIELLLLAQRGGTITSTVTENPLPVAGSPSPDPAYSSDGSLFASSGQQSISNDGNRQAADALIAAIQQLLASSRNGQHAAFAESGWPGNRPSSGQHVDGNAADDGNLRQPAGHDARWDARLQSLQRRRSTANDDHVAELPESAPTAIVPAPEAYRRQPIAAPSPASTPRATLTSSVILTPNPAAPLSVASTVPDPKDAAIDSAEAQGVLPTSDLPAAKVEPAEERSVPGAGVKNERQPPAHSVAAPKIQLRDSKRGRVVQPLDGVALKEVSLSDEATTVPEQRRFRPAAWLVSTVAHLIVLLVLGMLSLASQKPRDQLAFSAAVSETSAEVETFTIEASEALPEQAQQEPAEQTLEVNPMGVIPVTALALDLPPVAPAMEMFNHRANAKSNLSQVFKGNTAAKVQFAGVEGGGNHFIYLVDSSKSMRNFNEARNELLRSVEALQAHQRFYVVFYDEKPDYMRLTGSNADEPTSVLATAANKQALRRWAMTIQQQPGKSPTEVLPFAFKLRPDVIFLLSDGEFAAQTEEVIRKHNRQSNLFGEEGPISIIHTIRYPGYSAAEARNAEEQMKRIAAENGGQYRNIVLQ